MAYRSVPKVVASSSEDSDSSDDEDGASWKRRKTQNTSSMDVSFTNPVRQEPAPAPAGAKPRKKVNNIWGSVLLEQTITQELGGHAMDSFEKERDVESYDYKRFREERPPTPSDASGSDKDDAEEKMEDEKDNSGDDKEKSQGDKDNRSRNRKRRVHDRVGPKNSVKERLGRKNVKDRLAERKEGAYKSNNEDYIDVTPEDSKEKIVCALSENLREPKIDVLNRVVDTLGNKKSIDLMYETEMIEETGGLMTLDHSRRRTPGGVYFFLIKNDKDVTHDMYKGIFGEDQRKEFRKQAKARRKKMRKDAEQYQNNILLKNQGQQNRKPKNEMDIDENEPDNSEFPDKKDCIQDTDMEVISKDSESVESDFKLGAVKSESTDTKTGHGELNIGEIKPENKHEVKEELEDGELEEGEITD